MLAALASSWPGFWLIVDWFQGPVYLTLSQTSLANGSTALTHWGRVTHICVNALTIIGSDNGLSPGRRQAIIWTNAGILLTNFSEILVKTQIFSFRKMHMKMSSGKWRPFCLGLNVLKDVQVLAKRSTLLLNKALDCNSCICLPWNIQWIIVYHEMYTYI